MRIIQFSSVSYTVNSYLVSGLQVQDYRIVRQKRIQTFSLTVASVVPVVRNYIL